jgi:hypothetical protein
MESSPLEFIVVAEARADAEIACELADRVMVEDEESPDWLEAHLLDALRLWSGIGSATPFTKVIDVGDLYEELRKEHRLPRSLGHPRQGKHHSREYYQAARAILLAQRLAGVRPVRAMVLVRDMDTQPERCQDMELARDEYTLEAFDVVIGTPNPKREAWILNGFEPETPAENQSLAALRQDLGFHPCERAERLTAKRDTAKRSAKRVLGALTGDFYEREQRCWKQTNLDLLKRRGEATGLRDYLEDVGVRLLPLLKQ